MSDRLITVAIHTYDRAISLKNLLEREGISVTLQNVNLQNPVVSPGVRVRIQESDLAMALRLIENQDIFHPASSPKEQPVILVPIDFSDYSEKACDVAFRLAHRQNAVIVLLHSFIDQSFSSRIQLSDVLSFDERDSDIDRKAIILQEARRLMQNFCDSLRVRIKDGVIPAVKFSSTIIEGLPEEVINQYAKDNEPLMIVMGTRGTDAKEREQVGSVTAEVLDSCRFPVFTVPDAISNADVARLDRVLFFSNFDQEDILALDALFHLLPVEHLNVVMIKIPGKKKSQDETEHLLRRLEEYCSVHYPQHHFSIESLSINSIDEDFNRITEGICGKLIAVPNKKKNIFARLFNPGIAHRILFHSDIPMLVIPV